MTELTKGTIILAEPFLKDPSFKRSAVLICRHSNKEGAFGFAINKLLKTKLHQIVPEITDLNLQVHLGGPMEKNTLHYIHQYPQYLSDAERIFEGVYWGGDFELLKLHIKNGNISPQKIKFILGYSGWSEGQLEDEILEESWILTKANKPILFDTVAADIWRNSMIALGGKHSLMANYPTDPKLN